jgi:hypothetical protein
MNNGILLIRHDGDRLVLIEVPGAMPWPTALAEHVDRTLGAAGAPRPADTAERDRRDDDEP